MRRRGCMGSGVRRVGTALVLALCALAALGAGISVRAAARSGAPICSDGVLPPANRPAPTLSRTTGPAGTDVAASAAGWTPGVRVRLVGVTRDPKTGATRIVTQTLAETVIGADGTFTTRDFDAFPVRCLDLNNDFTIGFDAPEPTLALAAADDVGEVSAPAPFTFRTVGPNPPDIKLVGLIDHARVGTNVDITGTGWEPGSSVVVSLHEQLPDQLQPGDAPRLNPTDARTTADAGGSFALTYAIAPTSVWGQVAVFVVAGTGPQYGTLDVSRQVFLDPASDPTLLLDRTQLAPGEAVAVRGEHWLVGAPVRVRYCRDGLHDQGKPAATGCNDRLAQDLATFAPDAAGRITGTITIPGDARPGSVVVEASVPGLFMHPPSVSVLLARPQPSWLAEHPALAGFVGAAPWVLGPVALVLAVALVVAGLRRRRADIPTRIPDDGQNG